MRDRHAVPISAVVASAFRIPTETEESDGTAVWTSTTLVVVDLKAGGKTGFGYTYADAAVAGLINKGLAGQILGRCALDIAAVGEAMRQHLRNLGPGGLATMAMAAVDNALWDLKAKYFEVPLAKLIGQVRPAVSAYGSGGFTSLSDQQLRQHCEAWVEQGYDKVKIKVGRRPDADVQRVAVAKGAIGEARQLFVDANGAYSIKQALELAQRFHREGGVSWFEEPVSHENLAALCQVRQNLCSGMELSAGEYGYNTHYFQAMLQAHAVDVLQADASRCGISGYLGAHALAEAYGVPLSSHCAPSLHVALGVSTRQTRHLEFFYDHVRIERLLFDGMPQPKWGLVSPDMSRPGLGLNLKEGDAAAFAVM